MYPSDPVAKFIGMDHGFWHERWRSNLIGFHRLAVHPMLKRHFACLKVQQGDGVFVPLCGKSIDLLWLRDQGLSVVGVELSPIAAQALFHEHGLACSERPVECFRLFEAENLRIYCGDFFDLEPRHIAPCRAVYDRAALIALPADQRICYARHLAGLIGSGARILLVTLEYSQAEMTGLPFSVTPAEVKTLFGELFEIDQLECTDALGESQQLRERGLTKLTECAWLLTRRTKLA